MSHERESERGGAFTRRNFLDGAAYTAALSLPLESPAAGAGRPPPPVSAAPGRVTVTLRSNDQAYPLSIDSRASLLDAIRDHAGLMGTKKRAAAMASVEHAPCTWTIAAFSRA